MRRLLLQESQHSSIHVRQAVSKGVGLRGILLTCAGHDVVVGGPSGADMRFVKREWARYEAMLGAIGDPTSLEAAVTKRAHKRLAEIAAEVKLSSSGVVELANQVLSQDTYPVEARRQSLVELLVLCLMAGRMQALT